MCVRQWALIIHNLETPPSSWVKRFLPLVPKTQNYFVLDYACGSGRHTRIALEQGYRVLAVDINTSGVLELKKNLPQKLQDNLQVLSLDLEESHFPKQLEEYAINALVVTNYLYRPHLTQLFSLLAKGGILIYETFALGNEKFGKPSNPNFLLKKDELWQYIQPNDEFSIVSFEQGYVETPKPAIVQRICAVKQNSIGLQLHHEY
jgi:SAM-dependent methyltransferase